MAMSGAEKQRRYRIAHKGIQPEPRDIERVEIEYGPLPKDATPDQRSHRWQLYQAAALIRLYREDVTRLTHDGRR
jgi:hypothetical protein